MKKRLIAIAAMLACGAAFATIPGDPEACGVLGRFVRYMVEQRDGGMPLTVALAYTNDMIEAAMGKSNSIVQTKEDAEFIRQAVLSAWKSSDPPPIAGVKVLAICSGS